MKQDLTEMVFILDNSGSMSGLEKDTIGGFNSMIEKQRKVKGEALVTTVLFNTFSEFLHDRVKLEDVKPMDDTQYQVGGSTALMDALGETIERIEFIHKYIREEDVPEHTIFVITTDGMENASRKYTIGKIRELVEKKKASGWEFVFLGANIDAIKTAESYGMDQNDAAMFLACDEGVDLLYDSVSERLCMARMKANSHNRLWAKRLDALQKKQGNK